MSPVQRPSINSLPDSALTLVLERAGIAEGPSITLVCQRWYRCFYASEGLWRRFTLAPAPCSASPYSLDWWAAKRGLLLRISGTVEHLDVYCPVDSHREKQPLLYLASLAAQGSGVACDAEEVLQLLQPRLFPRLRCLSLAVPGISAAATAALGQLHQLGSLAVVCHGGGGPVPTCCIQTLADSLCQLTSLELDELPAPLPTLRSLAQLRMLRTLHISMADGGSEQGPAGEPNRVLPPPLSSFPCLESFSFRGPEESVQVAGCRLQACSFELGAAAHGNSLGDAGVLDGELTVSGLCRPWGCTLSQLLGALLPAAGAASFCRLTLEDCQLEASTQLLPPSTQLPASTQLLPPSTHLPQFSTQLLPPSTQLPASTQLAALTHLGLHSCGKQGCKEVLAWVLDRAPRLASLAVSDCSASGSLPACLAHRAGLRRLDLSWNNLLTELPDGPYLTGLEHLSLEQCALTALPQVLRGGPGALSALCSLTLTGNADLAFSAADAEMLAAHMPSLRQLRVGGTAIQAGVLRTLCKRLPQLRISA